ncbi:RNA polymerase II-associated protein 3 [Rhizopus azygosporus]|uniref:RNA polymerase II-associated protein 3 n=1 Tax=Rhizopus azygosporus TaxID=86630 RepID=A0A367JEY9_RHIAZ|nr:RNA polymerase II-associated protein 3 [Rhizopus azygosporus]
MTTNEALWNDLLKWQTDINKKDEALLKSKPIHDKAISPIREMTEIVLDNLKPKGLNALSSTSKNDISVNKKPTLIERAEAEKTKGNDYFKQSNFKQAVVHYTKAIELNPTVSVYYVNRAMAYIKLENYIEAERDCTKGIQFDTKNVKAYWRRGIALQKLGRIVEAKKDMELALKLEPKNATIAKDLQALISTNKTLPKEQKTNSENKFRSLPINVIDAAYEPQSSQQPPLTPVSTSKVNKTPQPVSGTPMATAKQTKDVKEITANITSVKEEQRKEKKTTDSVPAKVTTEKTRPAIVPSSTVPLKFSVPKTNFEFERDWKTCKARGIDVLYQYFQNIPPASFATLFKSSLESDYFEQMIHILATKYVEQKTPKDIYDVLDGLSRVKRLDMLLMFLSKQQEKELESLFTLIKSSDVVPKDKMDRLSMFYKIR